MFGGGERLVISLIEGLNRGSIIPEVFSEDEVNEEEVELRYKKRVNFLFRKINLPRNKILHLFKELFFNSPIIKDLKKYDFVYDFTNKPPLIFDSQKYLKYIYVLNDKRSARFSRATSAYITVTKALSSIGIKKFQRMHPGIINVTLSEFIQSEIKKATGVKVPIVYPPVSLNEFSCAMDHERHGVVSLGRFSPEKNYLLQIEIAKKFPKIHFTFIGSAKNRNYYQKIVQKVKSDSVQNVSLIPNASFKQVKKVLCQSLIFLHATIEEHFGLSTVEAIAAGCLPLVHNSGGQKEVVNYSEFRYSDIHDAEIKLQSMLNLSSEKKNEYHKSLRMDIQKYDEINFQNSMASYLD